MFCPVFLDAARPMREYVSSRKNGWTKLLEPLMGKVLIVDDSVDTCKVLSAFLTRGGHVTTCATSAPAALEKLQEELHDVVILDLMRPYENGIDCLRKIRQNPRTAELPVIIYSAVSERRYVTEAMENGATDYWLKGSIPIIEMES